ncbi:DNA-directed primase/polymerase protein [Acipenser oxyrinchus oxyrinchus]|uniref:DNA-directed primase/polymerase protein n=1 Tax=Acipenser oxyrinchus oxyrinchus TaxID=40147 RepID=A0AAD8LUE4_ACIOX|nr:DNA-directed primase/polymerase protein [Acipenser oxyrinchus oxyrinchus]
MIKNKWEERFQRVEQLAQTYQHRPLCSPYKPRLWKLWQPSSVWRVFPRQSFAIGFAKSCKEDVHVFALEKEGAEQGQRIYLVTTHTELWHYYKTYRQSLMHCYEVIPEGSVCKLYFDLEFHKPSNTSVDGKQMVSALIQYVSLQLDVFYGIKCSVQDVLNLDSSTEEKFSRHLIFLLPNAAFKDNIHVGNFLNKILQPAFVKLQRNGLVSESPVDDNEYPAVIETPSSSIGKMQSSAEDDLKCPQPKRHKSIELEASPAGQNEEFPSLFVKDKDGCDQIFVDLGVYTKNRNFRLYKSSKLGKNAAFEVAEDNMFIPKPQTQVTKEEEIFLCSLVSNVRFTDNLRILRCEYPQTEKTCPHSYAPKSTNQPDSFGGHQHSPYPEVDNFVLSLVNKENIQGGIRQWKYFSLDELLVYDILNYRWCQNIGRFHKSNNIMIVVDLKKEVWYQKCHDPVCRAEKYKSESYQLPNVVCLNYLITEEAEGFEYTMDEAGNIETSQSTFPAKKANTADELSHDDSIPSGNPPTEWDDWLDDESYLEALENTEQSDVVVKGQKGTQSEEIPDKLLLEALIEHESSAN